MYSLRPHTKIDFVRLWKYGFRLSGVLIALAIVGFIVSTVLTGAPLTLGTEFSGGTSIQINDAGDVTEDEIKDAFATAASELGYETQISSIQTAASMSGCTSSRIWSVTDWASSLLHVFSRVTPVQRRLTATKGRHKDYGSKSLS